MPRHKPKQEGGAAVHAEVRVAACGGERGCPYPMEWCPWSDQRLWRKRGCEGTAGVRPGTAYHAGETACCRQFAIRVHTAMARRACACKPSSTGSAAGKTQDASDWGSAGAAVVVHVVGASGWCAPQWTAETAMGLEVRLQCHSGAACGTMGLAAVTCCWITLPGRHWAGPPLDGGCSGGLAKHTPRGGSNAGNFEGMRHL